MNDDEQSSKVSRQLSVQLRWLNLASEHDAEPLVHRGPPAPHEIKRCTGHLTSLQMSTSNPSSHGARLSARAVGNQNLRTVPRLRCVCRSPLGLFDYGARRSPRAQLKKTAQEERSRDGEIRAYYGAIAQRLIVGKADYPIIQPKECHDFGRARFQAELN